jgi:uncharacterized protein (TIGR02145 family)
MPVTLIALPQTNPHLNKLLVISALFLFLIFGCKKNATQQQQNPTFALEKAIYYPFEAAQLNTANATLNDSSYTGSLNGNAIQFKNYNGKLLFFIPNLPAGNYNLKVLIAETEYTVALQVAELPSVPNPAVYFQNSVAQNDSAIAHITGFADSLPAADKTAVLNDLNTVNNLLNQLNTQYNNLNPAEKEEFAKVLAANSWWLNEVHDNCSLLLSDVASYKTATEVADYEQRVNISMSKYVTAVAVVVSHIPKIAFLTAAGALVGSVLPIIGTGVGASVGAGIAIGLMVVDVQTLMASIDRLVNTAILPTSDMLAQKTTTLINFTSNSERALLVKINYRSAYSADANSTIPVAAKFVKGLVDFKNAYLIVKSYLPASLRAPKLINTVPAYRILNLQVNSSYLSISAISNSNVALISLQKTEGQLLPTFKNNSNTAQNFTFKVNYTNPDFGNQSVTADATITTTLSTVTDIDGNIYHVIPIGNQLWMQENLKTTRYKDGTAITEIEDSTNWADIYTFNLQTDAWCYPNGSAANNATIGKLYNWFAAIDAHGVCPAGWHLPTDTEYTELTDYLGGEATAGGKMKVVDLWCQPNSGADNSSGFTALPVPFRSYYATWGGIEDRAIFWTATQYSTPTSAFMRELACFNEGVEPNVLYRESGLSIRCVKD